MDLIREHSLYKQVPLHVCVGDLTRQEQYEFVRLLVGLQRKDIEVCTHHGSVNQYVLQVLRALPVGMRECLRVV